MRIFSTILGISMISPLLSSVDPHPGYFMTRFKHFDDFFEKCCKDELVCRKEQHPFVEMLLEEKKQECLRLFKTRIFIDNFKFEKEISFIKNLINDEGLQYDIEKNEKIRVSNNNRKQPISAVFAHTEMNPILLEENVEKMENDLYNELVEDDEYSLLFKGEYCLLEGQLIREKKGHRSFKLQDQRIHRLCSGAAKYILDDDTKEMEIYKMNSRILNTGYCPNEVHSIELRSIGRIISEPLLECQLINQNNLLIKRYFIMLHPTVETSMYIVKVIKDRDEEVFHLKKHLGKFPLFKD